MKYLLLLPYTSWAFSYLLCSLLALKKTSYVLFLKGSQNIRIQQEKGVLQKNDWSL